jgi:SAM-dependent methyltransferase
MSGDRQPEHGVTHDWDAYWRNAQWAAAHQDGGPQDAALERFWLDLFGSELAQRPERVRIIDLGCGNGAVCRFALQAAQTAGRGGNVEIIGLDASPAALSELRRRTPEVCCIAGSALHLPLAGGTCTLATSQFGVEYAGTDAIPAAAAAVAPGGVLALILHLKNGGIFRECAANLEAIAGFRHPGLLPRFEALYRAALEVREGRAEAAAYRDADRRLSEAVTAAEGVLRRHGRGVANGMLYRVYYDVGYMYRRLDAYEPKEVFEWIAVMTGEMDSYAGRMASMLDAALDEDQFRQAVAAVGEKGLRIREQRMLECGQPPTPCAWVIIAERVL